MKKQPWWQLHASEADKLSLSDVVEDDEFKGMIEGRFTRFTTSVRWNLSRDHGARENRWETVTYNHHLPTWRALVWLATVGLLVIPIWVERMHILFPGWGLVLGAVACWAIGWLAIEHIRGDFTTRISAQLNRRAKEEAYLVSRMVAELLVAYHAIQQRPFLARKVKWHQLFGNQRDNETGQLLLAPLLDALQWARENVKTLDVPPDKRGVAQNNIRSELDKKIGAADDSLKQVAPLWERGISLQYKVLRFAGYISALLLGADVIRRVFQ